MAKIKLCCYSFIVYVHICNLVIYYLYLILISFNTVPLCITCYL